MAAPPWKFSTLSGEELTGVQGLQSYAGSSLVLPENGCWVSLVSCAIFQGNDKA